MKQQEHVTYVNVCMELMIVRITYVNVEVNVTLVVVEDQTPASAQTRVCIPHNILQRIYA